MFTVYLRENFQWNETAEGVKNLLDYDPHKLTYQRERYVFVCKPRAGDAYPHEYLIICPMSYRKSDLKSLGLIA